MAVVAAAAAVTASLAAKNTTAVGAVDIFRGKGSGGGGCDGRGGGRVHTPGSGATCGAASQLLDWAVEVTEAVVVIASSI